MMQVVVARFTVLLCFVWLGLCVMWGNTKLCQAWYHDLALTVSIANPKVSLNGYETDIGTCKHHLTWMLGHFSILCSDCVLSQMGLMEVLPCLLSGSHCCCPICTLVHDHTLEYGDLVFCLWIAVLSGISLPHVFQDNEPQSRTHCSGFSRAFGQW